MKVWWLGGKVNELVAAYLKARGLIDDFESGSAYTVLVINRDSVEIPFREFEEAVRAAVQGPVSGDEVRRIFMHAWMNVEGGRVEEISWERVVLRSTERTTLSFKIPQQLKERISRVAEREGKTMTQVVIEALESYLRGREPAEK